MNYKLFCGIALVAGLLGPKIQAENKIDRFALVTRHNVNITSFDTLNSLSVGNGDFAFTVDATGLQTFPEIYKNGVPLGTQSQWAWHSFPNTENYKLSEVLREYEFHGRKVSYSVECKDNDRQIAASNYLRQNAHRLHMGIVGLELTKADGKPAQPSDISQIDQTLNLWTGEILSKFIFEGEIVEVKTVSHQNKDLVSTQIKSKLIAQGKLKVKLRFPFPTGNHTDWACDWNSPKLHSSVIESQSANTAIIKRKLDTTIYYVSLATSQSFTINSSESHAFTVKPSSGDVFDISVGFTSKAESSKAPLFVETESNSFDTWKNYWSTGGAVDFSGSTDIRANELERRVILSQYLTRIQCGGTYPPQETGLTYNSWFGKYHLEMHWWHAAHFAQWGHPELLQKSMWWYASIADKARITAQRQGFDGIRWPKMVDISGNETPSKIGQMLIWQQPHYIYFAEQLYRNNKSDEVLKLYKDYVFATADFMASFAWYDKENDRYVLGPSIIAAQETINKTATTINTPYELVYWYWALKTAQQWRERLGLPRVAKWDDVINKLPKLPQADGLYLVAENATDSYTNLPYISDHPAVLGAYGVLPSTPLVDPKTMAVTYDKIMKVWNWPTTWGWDYPMISMSAVRLGEPEKAIDALLLDVQKNTYLKNGHNYQDGRLRIYLPGNGGLLATVAMMCAGYDGCTTVNPGIPKNGKWNVRWEGLTPLP